MDLANVPGPARTSLREYVQQAVRNALLDGSLQPDELFSATQLAKQLGVSSTPVREALLDLARDGILIPERNRGFRVALIDHESLIKLAEVRSMLEVPALAVIAKNLSDADYTRLSVLAQQADVHAQALNRFEYARDDRIFHVELTKLAGNKFVTEIVSDFRNRSRLAMSRTPYDHQNLSASSHDHQIILDALRQGEIEKAQRVLTHHILDQ